MQRQWDQMNHPVKRLKLEPNQDSTLLRDIHRMFKLVWRERKVPEWWRDAVINVFKTRKAEPSAGIIAAFHS